MRKNSLIFLVFSLLITSLFGQSTETIKRDTVLFEGYTGAYIYSVRTTDQGARLQGPVTFDSELLIQLENDTVWFRELDINGNYSNGKRNGLWKYDFDAYYLNEASLAKRWDIRLNFRLDGKETTYLLTYKDGLRHGKWEKRVREARVGRFRAAQTIIRLEFDENILVGAFNGEREIEGAGKVKVSGNLNPKGFLQGELNLRYMKGGECIEELRTYKDGFLLRLEKKTCGGDLLQEVVYEDVEAALKLLETSPEQAVYTVSDEGFGLRFNNGYLERSEQLRSQEDGNQILDALFNLFNPFCEVDAAPVLKVTRRFKYFYPEYEDSLLAVRLAETLALKKDVNSFLERPNFRMRKSNNDSLVKAYYRLEVAMEKLTLLELALKQIEEGFFTYRDRNFYYKNGIPGLNQPDSIAFSFQGKEYQIPFGVKLLITQPDNLMQQIDYYLSEMRMSFEGWKKLVDRSLTLYENQEFIDSLDAKIGKFELLMRKAYDEVDDKRKEKMEDVPFSYRLYFSVEERLLGPASVQYLENNLPFEIASEVGRSISCLMEFLATHKNELDRIGKLGRIWNDSLFTIRIPNPFDTRPFETKILGGVQQGGTILFRHYATRLLNARSCQSMQEELNMLRLLEHKMRYLAKHHENAQVQLLDRTLRRERVPARLERILELK